MRYCTAFIASSRLACAWKSLRNPLISNTSRALDARVECSFVSAGRPVGAAEFGPTSVAPGEQIRADLIGPPTTAHVDSTTCHLVGQ